MSIGALAETVAVDARNVWKAPAGVPLSHCSNIGRNFFAAYHSLKDIGEVRSGDLVLVDGASGGVGMASIELVVLGERLEQHYGRRLPFGPFLASLRNSGADDLQLGGLVAFLRQHV